MAVRAYLRGVRTYLSGSPARGSEQWWTARIGESDMVVKLSGSGPYLELEGTDQSPILPLFDLHEAVRSFSVFVTAYNTSERNKYVNGEAYADWAGHGQSRFLVQGPNLEECLELARQIEDKTAKVTSLTMRSAVAVATRRKLRPLNPTPHCQRRNRPAYACCGCGNGKHYRLCEK